MAIKCDWTAQCNRLSLDGLLWTYGVIIVMYDFECMKLCTWTQESLNIKARKSGELTKIWWTHEGLDVNTRLTVIIGCRIKLGCVRIKWRENNTSIHRTVQLIAHSLWSWQVVAPCSTFGSKPLNKFLMNSLLKLWPIAKSHFNSEYFSD